jgi:hypothetical protein
MASTVPATNQEAMMRLLQDISVAMAAPDADLVHLAELQKSVVASIRAPMDTPANGSPVGGGQDLSGPGPSSAMNMSNGVMDPFGQGAASTSPMMQALVGQATGGGGRTLPPGSYQAGGLATRTPPDMGELQRILTMGAP